MSLSLEEKYTVLIEIIKELRGRGSWCGETHVQKAAYLIDVLSSKDLGYDFVMYKHGPFSFELREELGVMRGAGLISLVSPQVGYGPSLVPTNFAEKISAKYFEKMQKMKPAIAFVCDWFGKKDVKELEKLATAFYVLENSAAADIRGKALELHQIKPHIPLREAERLLDQVGGKREEAMRQLKIRGKRRDTK